MEDADMGRLVMLAVDAHQPKMGLDDVLSILGAQDLGDHLYVDAGDEAKWLGGRGLTLEMIELLHKATGRAIVTRCDGEVWRWDEHTPDSEWVEQGLISYEGWLAKIMVAP